MEKMWYQCEALKVSQEHCLEEDAPSPDEPKNDKAPTPRSWKEEPATSPSSCFSVPSTKPKTEVTEVENHVHIGAIWR